MEQSQLTIFAAAANLKVNVPSSIHFSTPRPKNYHHHFPHYHHHFPHCEQLVLKPERTTVVTDAKVEMSSLAKDMASVQT